MRVFFIQLFSGRIEDLDDAKRRLDRFREPNTHLRLRDRNALKRRVRELMGITASAPTWKYLPDQMMPGLTVPVISPLSPRSNGSLSETSTNGMRRSNGARRPMFRTCSCK